MPVPANHRFVPPACPAAAGRGRGRPALPGRFRLVRPGSSIPLEVFIQRSIDWGAWVLEARVSGLRLHQQGRRLQRLRCLGLPGRASQAAAAVGQSAGVRARACVAFQAAQGFTACSAATARPQTRQEELDPGSVVANGVPMSGERPSGLAYRPPAGAAACMHSRPLAAALA